MANYFSLRQCIYSSTLDKNSNKYAGDDDAKKIGGNVPGDDYTSDRPDLKKDTIIININNLMNKCVNPIKDRFPDTVITSVYRSKTTRLSLIVMSFPDWKLGSLIKLYLILEINSFLFSITTSFSN